MNQLIPLLAGVTAGIAFIALLLIASRLLTKLRR
jgi:hypothetical protein